MFKKNERRLKKIILSYSENKILYKKVKFLFILLFSLLIIIISIDTWSASQLENQKNSLFGEWDEVFINVDKGKLSYFRNNAFIDNFAIQCIQDQIIYEGKKIVVGYTDSNFLNLGNIKMLEGRLPKNNREIALEEDLLPLLKVKQIGDLVPDNLNVKELEGLRLCGIVEKYSSRWNSVNWNVPFINCFINNSSKGEYYIYTDFSSNIKKDIEINMLNYKNNITFEFNSLLSITYKILFLFVFLIILLIIKLFSNSYKYFFNDYIEIEDKKIQNNIKIKTIINIIGLIILYVLFSFLFSILINRIKLGYYSVNNCVLPFINQSSDYIFLISKNSSTFIENYVVSKQNFTILFFLNKQHIFLFNQINLIIWIVFINWIILECFIKNFKLELTSNPHWELFKFYYGKSYFQLWVNKKFLIIFLGLELCVNIFNYIILKYYYITDDRLFYVFCCCLIVNIIRVIINYYIIKTRIKNIENNYEN